MLANPAANAMCANGSSRRLDEDARGLRPLCARQRDRTGPDFGDELTVQMPLAVVELPGEAGDALAVDDAVRDQAHRATDEVGALVPLRGTGRRVGAAALAGPEPGELCRGRSGEEPHVGALRQPGRTARPAVDPGARDGAEEPPVEPGIPALHRPVALLRIFEHGRSVTGAGPLR